MTTTDDRDRPPRIAVVVQGDPRDPRGWSGSPAGICAGLEAAGCEVIAVDARPPGTARLTRRRGWAREAADPIHAAVCGWTADLGIRRAKVAGVVAIGSGYLLSTQHPVVTFEDETVAQAARQPTSAVSQLTPRQAERWRSRQGRIYERSRGCGVGSSWIGRSIVDDYGIDPAKVHVVGFGRNFDPVPAERDWCTPHYLFLGVDWEIKRGPAVLAAFAEIRREIPAATLDVVGEHPPLNAEGVTGHGQLARGRADDRARLVGLLSRATCLTLPSSREAFGIAYVDAAAAGVPSIGTTAGGAPETIGPGGLVVDPGDQPGLVAAMRRMADPETAQRFGQEALERSALFTWPAVAERLLRIMRPPGVEVESLAEFIEAR